MIICKYIFKLGYESCIILHDVVEAEEYTFGYWIWKKQGKVINNMLGVGVFLRSV